MWDKVAAGDRIGLTVAGELGAFCSGLSCYQLYKYPFLPVVWGHVWLNFA